MLEERITKSPTGGYDYVVGPIKGWNKTEKGAREQIQSLKHRLTNMDKLYGGSYRGFSLPGSNPKR